MARLRFNGLLTGTATPTLGAALTNVATSMTLPFAFKYQGGTAVPTIAAPDVMVLTLEPDTGLEEVVWVTAYTTGATTATVLRGQENTAAVAHTINAPFIHGPTAADFKSAATRLALRALA